MVMKPSCGGPQPTSPGLRMKESLALKVAQGDAPTGTWTPQQADTQTDRRDTQTDKWLPQWMNGHPEGQADTPTIKHTYR